MASLPLTDPQRKAAALLLAARSDRAPIDPLSGQFPDMTVDDAYAIQLTQVDHWTSHGDAVKGYKVGLTSRAMQRQLGVDQPDFGHLLTSMFHLEHQGIDTSAFIQPKIEPEIAFVLGKDLSGPGVTVAEALRSIDFVLPALEIIDSRIRDWRIGVVDTVADNASCGGVVLGSHPVKVDAVDLATAGCSLLLDSQVVATGAGGAVLGSPVTALVWLVNTLGARGIAFRAGDVVLAGSVTPAYQVAEGTVATVRFAGLGAATAVFR